jgi:hypothetical protein
MDTFSTTAASTYSLAILSGGPLMQVTNVSFVNLGFSNSGIASIGGNASLSISSSNFTTLASTSGNGVIMNSPSASVAYDVVFTMSNCVLTNISTPYASYGGLVYIANSTSSISFTNVSSMELRIFLLL